MNKKNVRIDLKDQAFEMALLSGICQYGIESFVDVDYVEAETFTDQTNQILFDIVKSIITGGNNPDVSSIFSKANSMGFGKLLEKDEEVSYIRSLFNFPVNKSNITTYAKKLTKLKILRDATRIFEVCKQKIETFTGEEDISEIMSSIEDPISKLTQDVYNTNENKPVEIGSSILDYVHNLLTNPSQFLGIPTGISEYDKAIGGGLREGCVDIIAARPKAQPLHSKVLTPKGWTTIGKIKIGQTICDPEGYTSKVKNIHCFQDDIYKFTFDDGSSCEASGNHLWKIKNRRWKEYKVLSWNEIKHQKIKESDRYKWQIPITFPVSMNNKKVKIHPYVMGALLGDGSFRGPTIRFTSFDQEIIDKVKLLLNDSVELKEQIRKGHFCIRKKEFGSNKTYVKYEIIRYGLNNLKSKDKFIPKDYLETDIQSRVNLLQGLMDTDGYVSEKGSLEFATVSTRLKDDFIYLVNSLGGKCSSVKRFTKYKKNGTSFKSLRIILSFYNNSIAFSLPRKLKRCKVRVKPSIKRKLVNVEYIGKMECRCLELDSENQLYITDDFIVTHNCGKSTFGLQVALNIDKLGYPVLILDTEMDTSSEMNRLIANISGVDVNEVAKGNKAFGKTLIDAAKKFENSKIEHINVSGMSFDNILSIARQWIYRKVGFREDGKANKCVIIYDYLKLTSGSSISDSLKEYQILGFQMTDLHNFCVKYSVPCLAFVQLNKEDDISQSDRILWLCTSYTKFKEKSQEEQADDIKMSIKVPFNRKLEPIVSRYGAPMDYGDYINLRMCGDYARITVGPTRNELMKGGKINAEVPDISKSGQDTDDSGVPFD